MPNFKKKKQKQKKTAIYNIYPQVTHLYFPDTGQ